MKKVLSVILSLVMVLSCIPFFVSAADETFTATVATDLHHSYSRYLGTVPNYDDPWEHIASGGKMTYESHAILEAFLADIAKEDTDFLILCGDLSDSGSYEESAYMAARLLQFEQDTGKTVFVCMGNHEGYKITASEFKTIYAGLGYDKAIAIDPNSASYVADLKGNYRVLFIDTINYTESEAGMSDEKMAFVEEQALKAKADGKTLITVTHHNLIDHFLLHSDIFDTNVVQEEWELPDKLIEWGVTLNFSGHTHEMDIAKYSTDNGTIYDCVTSSLTTAPCGYRYVTFSKNTVDIQSEYVEKIDTSLLPAGMPQEALDLISTDFNAYKAKAFKVGCDAFPKSYLTTSRIISLLKIDDESGEAAAVLDKIMPKLYEILYAPLYGEGSVSEMADELGLIIPESDYNTMLEATVAAYMAHVYGNEDLPGYSPEVRIFVDGLAVAVNYALADVSAEDFTKIITILLEKLGYADKVPSFVAEITGEGVDRLYGIECFLTLYKPVFEVYTVDSYPDDLTYTVNLSGEEEVTISSIFAFLKKIWYKFLSIFQVLKETFKF